MVVELGTLLAMAAAIAELRRRASPPAWLAAAACAASAVAVMASWLGVVTAAVLGLWLLRQRGLDRPTVAVGLSMAAGVAVTLAFVVGVSGLPALLGQGGYRTSGGDFTAGEFFRQQWDWLRGLLPAWYLALFPVGLAAALADRRTRFFAAFSAVLAVAWVVGLPNGSYIHDYWAFVVLVPGVVGMAALLDRLLGALPRRVAGASAAAGCGLLTVVFAQLVTGPSVVAYFSDPARAGELVRDHGPSIGQRHAYHLGVGAPRWLSYYWDLPARPATPLALSKAQPDHLVLVKLDRFPSWAAEGAAERAVARNGHYALVRAADLLRD